MSIVEKSIGELLVDNGQISAEELRLAEREARSTGEPLSLILSRLGLAYEHHFKNALELKYGVTYVSLARTDIQAEILKKVPEAKLREHMMVPVNEKGTRITVVMVNPEHTSGLSALKEYFTDRQFTPVVCTEDDFMLFMNNLYRDVLNPKTSPQEKNGAKEEKDEGGAKAETVQSPQSDASKVDDGANSQAQTPSAESAPAAAKASDQPANSSSEVKEPPTNDETGKFDLNMLQKHIEATRNKAGKKPAEEPINPADVIEISVEKADEKAKQPQTETSAAKSDEDSKAIESSAKDAEIKADTGEAKTTQESEKAKEDKDSEKPAESTTSSTKSDEKIRQDARDVARAIAREMAEESKNDTHAMRDDEATGEFDALKTGTPVKKAAATQETKEETASAPSPQEAPETAAETSSEASPEPKPEAPKEPDPQAKTSAPLDQTGEDFKAVRPKPSSEGGFGECEPVASESHARPPAQNQKGQEALEKEGDDAAVIMLCNQILANGIAKGASTIHVEAVDKQVLVHYRIQGQLLIVRKLPKMLMPALTARFRKMGRVDTQDRRLPQDGRVKVRMSGKDFSLRLTIVPHTAGGEHILVWIE